MTARAPRTTTAPTITRRRDPGDDAVGLARLLATAYLEIRDGHRPAVCLRPHISPAVDDVIADVVRRHRRRRPGSRPVVPLRVVTTADRQGLEASVVVRHGDRVTAVAMRLEIRDGRWLVTALQAPEDAAGRSIT